MAFSDIEPLLEMDKSTFVKTRWRLLGFGDVGGKYIRIAEPKDTDFEFWFQFHEDGTFEGRSSGNLLAGNYLFFENNQIELLDFFVLTYAGETKLSGSSGANNLAVFNPCLTSGRPIGIFCYFKRSIDLIWLGLLSPTRQGLNTNRLFTPDKIRGLKRSSWSLVFGRNNVKSEIGFPPKTGNDCTLKAWKICLNPLN